MAFQGQFVWHKPPQRKEGACLLSWTSQSLELTPQPLGDGRISFDLGQIRTFKTSDWDVTLALLDGTVLKLHHFAKATAVLAGELKEAWRERVSACILAGDLRRVNGYDCFVTTAGLGRNVAGPAHLLLFQSNLALLAEDGATATVPLGRVHDVVFDRDRWTVLLRGPGLTVEVGKLGPRTDTFVREVQECLGYTRKRCAQVLRQVLPGLDSALVETLVLRWPEGELCSAAELAGVRKSAPTQLLQNAVNPSLRPYLERLLQRGGQGNEGAWYVGYKLLPRTNQDEEESAPGMARKRLERVDFTRKQASDPDPDSGVDPEMASDPDSGVDPERAGGADWEQGFAGGQAEPNLPDGQPSPTSALSDALIWFLCPVHSKKSGDLIAWEASSQEGHATYLFKGGVAELPRLNQALVGIHFRREPIFLSLEKLASDPKWTRHLIADQRLSQLSDLRRLFHARLLHTDVDSWEKGLSEA